MARNRHVVAVLASAAFIISAHSSIAFAESYYSGSGFESLIKGKTVVLTEGSVIQYKANGDYTYKKGVRSSRGKYRINGAKVCVNFIPSGYRCDKFVKDGSSLYLENSGGARYKVRSIQ